MLKTYFDTIKTPLGKMMIKSSRTGLILVNFISENEVINPLDLKSNKIIRDAKRQLKEYFKGKRSVFDLPMDIIGTEFQMSVWHEISKIPFGKTTTYSKLAWLMGNNKFARAVGTTTGKNPLWIIIPCHRVVGKNGALIGYAGGLWRKQWLLEHETKNNLF
jgi:O-6-methylguanine DNA methyltransferase